MARKKLTFGTRVNVILGIVLVLSFILYFLLRDQFLWIRDIFPGLISIGILSLLLSIMIDRKMSVNAFLSVFGGMFLISTSLFIYGTLENVRFLVDVTPEFIGISLVTFIVAYIRRRKIIV